MIEKTIFEKIGGKDAVNIAVEIFYKKVLADDRIKMFFEDINMIQQRAHQKAFLTYVFGGSSKYDGKSLREAHKKLVEQKGLNESHFNAVAENLVATLNDLNIQQDLIDEIVALLLTVKNDILNK